MFSRASLLVAVSLDALSGSAFWPVRCLGVHTSDSDLRLSDDFGC